MSRMVLAVATGVLILLGCAAFPSGAAASTEPNPIDVSVPSDPYSAEIVAIAADLMTVAGPIVDLSDPYEAADPAQVLESAQQGFGGVSIDVQTRTVHLAWKGEMPDAISRIIESAPSSISVELSHAKYSLTELRALQPRVRSIESKLNGLLGVELVSISTGTTGSGLTVGYSVPQGHKDPGADAIVEALAGLSDAPVLGAVQKGALEVTGTRQNDATPWHGGSQIQNDGGGFCSNGFPALKGGNEYLLTAAHCRYADASGTFYDATGQTIGSYTSAGVNFNTDSVRYHVSSTSTVLYNGAWNSGDKITLHGKASNVVGLPVCTNGAMSGTHCYAEIADVGADIDLPTDSGGTVKMTVPVEAVSTQSGKAINVAGDSGGPVYSKVTVGGVTEANAMGMIYGSFGNYSIPCTTTSAGHYYSPDPRCYTDVLWPSITGTLTAQGATLNTD